MLSQKRAKHIGAEREKIRVCKVDLDLLRCYGEQWASQGIEGRIEMAVNVNKMLRGHFLWHPRHSTDVQHLVGRSLRRMLEKLLESKPIFLKLLMRA